MHSELVSEAVTRALDSGLVSRAMHGVPVQIPPQSPMHGLPPQSPRHPHHPHGPPEPPVPHACDDGLWKQFVGGIALTAPNEMPPPPHNLLDHQRPYQAEQPPPPHGPPIPGHPHHPYQVEQPPPPQAAVPQSPMHGVPPQSPRHGVPA